MALILHRAGWWTLIYLLISSLYDSTSCWAAALVTFERQAWPANISAQGYYNSQWWTGEVDLKKDIGIRDTRLSSRRWTLGWNERNRLTYDTFSGQYFGQATYTERSVIFIGRFPISRLITHRMTNSMQLSYQKLGWNRDFWQSKNKNIRLGYILDVKRISGEAKATVSSSLNNSTAVVQSGKTNWKFTAPTLGVSLDSTLAPCVKAHAEISGLKIGNFTFYDSDVNITIFLNKKQQSGLMIGYRKIDYSNSKYPVSTQLNHFQLAGTYYGFITRF